MFGFLFKTRPGHPSKPWLRNKNWAAGRIPNTGDASSSSGLLVVGLVCAGFSLGAFLFQYFGGLPHIAWGGIVVTFLFAVAFIAGAIYTRALRRKFGRTYLCLDSIPGVVGGELSGSIQMEKPMQQTTTLLIRLRCVEVIPDRSHDSRDDRVEVLWEGRQAMSFSHEMVGKRREFPVSFQLPGDARPTDDPSARHRIYWQLEVTAKLEGLDFNATFVVPVYRLADVPGEAVA